MHADKVLCDPWMEDASKRSKLINKRRLDTASRYHHLINPERDEATVPMHHVANRLGVPKCPVTYGCCLQFQLMLPETMQIPLKGATDTNRLVSYAHCPLYRQQCKPTHVEGDSPKADSARFLGADNSTFINSRGSVVLPSTSVAVQLSQSL